MNEETLNLSIRKFLKVVGINSQREIERAVARLVSAGTHSATSTFPATMRLDIDGLDLHVTFDGEIKIE